MTESVLADAIRPFWLPGISNATGGPYASLREWFSAGSYQISSPTQNDSFVLDVLQSDVSQLISGFAADINRLATAAFESVVLISRSRRFPKSTAWLLVNSYYAAFFSAHAILRALGLGCSQLGPLQVTRINDVAALYGADGAPVSRGLYRCTFDASGPRLTCQRVDISGVHEGFWYVFHQRLVDLSNEVLLDQNLPRPTKQYVSGKLADLVSVLETENAPHGNWLSQVRNKVTYNQQLGVWYPYPGRTNPADDLFRQTSAWLRSPLELTFQLKSPLRRFQEACVFLVGLCRVLTEDLHARSATGRSFCRNGSVAFLRLMAQGG